MLTVEQPMAFSITIHRPYQWGTERPQEQVNFLMSLVRLHRKVTGTRSLQVVGIQVPDLCTRCYMSTSDHRLLGSCLSVFQCQVKASHRSEMRNEKYSVPRPRLHFQYLALWHHPIALQPRWLVNGNWCGRHLHRARFNIRADLFLPLLPHGHPRTDRLPHSLVSLSHHPVPIQLLW